MKLCVNFKMNFQFDCLMNKKVLIMIFMASGGTIFQMIFVSIYPLSEFHIVPYVSLAFFGIILSIEITLYSKVKKELFN